MRHICLMRGVDVSKTEQAIYEAGFTLLSRKPGASMSEVAEEAGVGRATLHRYFASRSDLVTALARLAIVELDAAVDSATAGATSHGEALRLSMQAVIPLAHRHMFLMQEEIPDPEIQAAFAKDMQELRQIIDAAKAEGALRLDLPTEWVAHAYENLIYAAWEMIQREEATPRQAKDLAWDHFSKGACQ